MLAGLRARVDVSRGESSFWIDVDGAMASKDGFFVIDPTLGLFGSVPGCMVDREGAEDESVLLDSAVDIEAKPPSALTSRSFPIAIALPPPLLPHGTIEDMSH